MQFLGIFVKPCVITDTATSKCWLQMLQDLKKQHEYAINSFECTKIFKFVENNNLRLEMCENYKDR